MATLQSLNFTPKSISGLQVWLDGQDPNGNSILPANGATVGTWTDKSGNGNNGTAVNTPTYSVGNKAVSATSGAYYTFPNGAFPFNDSSYTYFHVFLTTTTGTTNNLFGGGTPGGTRTSMAARLGSGNVIQTYWWNNGVADLAVTNTYSANVPSIAQTWYTSGGSRVITLNFAGSNTDSPAVPGARAQTNSNNYLGQGYTPDGALVGLHYEFLVFNSSLTTADRQQVEGYLAWKWGIQGSLPTTHPYYRFAPNSANLPYPANIPVTIPRQSFLPTTAPIVLFNPKSISGLSVWLDAADAATITLSGSTITQWADKSGNGYSGTSTASRNFTYVTAVQNGLNVAQTATGQTLILSNVTLGPTLSAFLLCYPLNQSTGSPFLEHGPDTNTNSGFFLHTQNASQIGIRNTSGYVVTSAYPNYTLSNTWQLPTLVNPDPNASSQMSFYLNGSLKFSLTSVSGSNVTQALYLNGRNNTNTLSYASYIAELLIYSAALTNAQRQQVEGYLAWKWGIQSTLPSNHLYKTVIPSPFNVPVLTGLLNAASFSPRNISNLGLWLDAADSSTLTLTDSSVSQWNDKSGNGRNASQATSSRRPVLQTNQINGLPVIKWDGVDDSLAGNLTYPTTGQTTVFLVYNITSSADARLFDINGNSYGNIGVHWTITVSQSADIGVWLGGTTYPTDAIYTQAAASTGIKLASVVLNGTSTVIYRNGSFMPTFGSGANVTPTGTTYTLGNVAGGGNSGMYNGQIAEIVFYSANLSSTQRQQVEGYLAWKWNLVGNLPATHPYKKFPPPP